MSKCYEAFDRKSIENSVFKGNLVANGGYFLVNGYLRSVGTGRDLSLKRLFAIHRDTVAIRRDRSRPVLTTVICDSSWYRSRFIVIRLRFIMIPFAIHRDTVRDSYGQVATCPYEIIRAFTSSRPNCSFNSSKELNFWSSRKYSRKFIRMVSP